MQPCVDPCWDTRDGGGAGGWSDQSTAGVFATPDAGAGWSLSLNGILSDLETVLVETLGEGIELKVVPEEGLPAVYVDPSQMRRVVLNMAIHARDAMPLSNRA